MKKIVNILIVAMAAMVAVGCTKQIEFDGEVTDAKVIMQSKVYAGEKIEMRLCYSRFFLDVAPFKMIDNAQIELKVNGQLRPVAAAYDRDEGVYILDYTPEAGDVLEVAVRVPGREEVTEAATTMPKDVNISNFAIDVRNGEESNDVMVRFRLNDPADEDNYYAIRLEQLVDVVTLNRAATSIEVSDTIVSIDTVGYNEDSTQVYVKVDTTYIYDTTLVYDTTTNVLELYFDCTDFLLTGDDESLLDLDMDGEYYELTFSDAKINGMQHEVQLKTKIKTREYNNRDYDDGYDYYETDYHGAKRQGYELTDANGVLIEKWLMETVKVRVCATSISRDLYLYEQSVDLQDAGLDFFREPVQIHSNVENGYGVFAASNTKYFEKGIND